MFKKWRIARTQALLSDVYKEYLAEIGSMDCGTAVAESINPRIVELRAECNARLDALRA